MKPKISIKFVLFGFYFRVLKQLSFSSLASLYYSIHHPKVVQNIITVKRELSGLGFEKQAAGASGSNSAISYAAEGSRDQTSDQKITTLTSQPQAFEQTLSRYERVTRGHVEREQRESRSDENERF